MFIFPAWRLISAFTLYQLLKLCSPQLSSMYADVAVEEEISRSLIEIGNRYFEKDLPVAVMISSTWPYPPERDSARIRTGDTLLRNVNEMCKWPVIIPEPFNSQIQLNSLYIKSLVLFLGDGDLEEKAVVMVKMLRTVRISFKNIPLRIIIIAMDVDLMGIHFFEVARLFLTFAWKTLKSYDVILLLHEEKTHSHITYKSVVVDIFTWFPHNQEDNCSDEVNTVTMLDTWMMPKRDFKWRANLFPKKVITDMKGCSFNVFPNMWPPLVSFIRSDYESSKIIQFTLEGVYIQVLNTAAQAMNFRFIYTLDDSCVPDIIGPYNLSFETAFQPLAYIYPHFKDEITWFVPSAEEIPRWQGLIRTFSYKMWFFVIVSYILGSVSFWIIPKFRHKYIIQNRHTGIGLVLCFLDMLRISLGSEAPEKQYRFLFILWLFYCLQIYTAYQSSLIGFLAHPGDIPAIKYISELEDSHLEMVTSFATSFSENDNDYPQCLLLECLRRVAFVRDAAALVAKGAVEMVVLTEFSSGGQPRLVPLKENVRISYLTMYFPKGYILHRHVDDILQKLFSAGLTDKWLRDYNDVMIKRYYRFVWNNNVVFASSLSHMQGAFYVLALGFVCAIVVFIVEIVFKILCARFWNIE